jgi:hypothetical protein
VRHRYAEDDEQSSARSYDDSHGSVHERRLCELGTPREGERLLGHGWRTADLPWRARRRSCVVRPQHDVRVEHREKRSEVTGARGSGEGVDHVALPGAIGVRRNRSLHPTARAARELSCRVR